MAIAQSLYLYVLLTLLLAFSFKATSTSHHGLKSLHLTLYQQDTLNKTSYVIVKGVTGNGVTPTTAPFGTMFVYQDLFTIKSDSSSKVVGMAEGFSISSAFDGLRTINVEKFTLKLKHHKGSVSIVGSSNTIKPSDNPVVGGTGDFMFVQGYVTYSPVDVKSFKTVYKVEFHLYWPPYANQSSLHD